MQKLSLHPKSKNTKMIKTIALLLVYLLPIAVMCQSNHDSSQKKQSSEVDDRIFTKLEQEASFLGGQEAWENFMEKNFKYPFDAERNEIQGTVIIQFVVNKDGSVSDVEGISGPEDLYKEAVRIIKKSSGKWIPGKQNNYVVRSYKKQPIVFKLTDKPNN
jgi:TonB family protein